MKFKVPSATSGIIGRRTELNHLASIGASGKSSKSPYLELCREAFTPDGYFFNECERIFVSSLANNPHYRPILQLLANAHFLTRSEIAQHLQIAAGGTLTALLLELEASGLSRPKHPASV